MAQVGSIIKQVNEVLDYEIDYAKVFEGRSDSLASVTSTVTPSGALTATATVSGTKVKVVVSGGLNSVSYKVETLATTNTTPIALKYEDEVTVLVENI